MHEPLITPVPGSAGIDFLYPGAGGVGMGGSGSVAETLLRSGMSINSLRPNTVLRKDEWIMFDRTVIETSRRRMNLTADLLGRGLSFNVPNALGVSRIEWQMSTHMEGAHVDMSGITPGREDRIEFSLIGLPLPIIHKEFRLNIRVLEMSRRMGTPLDTMEVAQATRLVSETIEGMILTGWPVAYGGMSIYGLLNAPNRNTGTLTGQWSLIGTTGATIVADVMAMIAQAQADFMYGPYQLYIPLAYDNKLNEDYKAESDMTIRQRILQIPSIAGIQPTEFMANHNVILVQLTSDVIDIVNGFGPTLLQWESHGGMLFHFKVMAIMVPRVKWDALLRSGIVHYTG